MFCPPELPASYHPSPSSSPFEARPPSLSQVLPSVSGKISHPPPHCEKCGTVVAKQWRKNTAGGLYCERCGTDQHLINVNLSPKELIKVIPRHRHQIM